MNICHWPGRKHPRLVGRSFDRSRLALVATSTIAGHNNSTPYPFSCRFKPITVYYGFDNYTMNNINYSILSWLESVPTDLSSAGAHLMPKDQFHSKRRPYFDSERPLSPPPSQHHMQDISSESDLALQMQPSTPSNKRRRLGGVPILAAHAIDAINDDNDDDANEETPTQEAPQSVNNSNNSSRQSSHTSNHSSPSKRF